MVQGQQQPDTIEEGCWKRPNLGQRRNDSHVVCLPGPKQTAHTTDTRRARPSERTLRLARSSVCHVGFSFLPSPSPFVCSDDASAAFASISSLCIERGNQRGAGPI